MSAIPSVAVYSTYCGTNDNRTIVQQDLNRNFPHYYLSNNPDILRVAQGLGWIPVFLKLEISDDPVVCGHQAKIAKTVPHLFPVLGSFDYLFYIDDKRSFNAAILPALIQQLNTRDWSIAVRPHAFLSSNILFEFGQAMLQPRYRMQWANTVDYISRELREGFTLECQLYWTSAILRNMHHPDTRAINDLWYAHIQRCGTECQISFDFVAQRFRSVSLLPADIAN